MKTAEEWADEEGEFSFDTDEDAREYDIVRIRAIQRDAYLAGERMGAEVMQGRAVTAAAPEQKRSTEAFHIANAIRALPLPGDEE